MFVYHTTLNLAKILTKQPSKPTKEDIDVQIVNVMEAWNHLEFLYWNNILNCLVDLLYNVYSMKKMTKELWESLQQKHKIEDIGTSRFLGYKMVDSKIVISQI